MRIACISDVHSLHSKVNVPEDVDVTVCTGDFTGRGRVWEVRGFLTWFSLRRRPVLIGGNHDFWLENRVDAFREMLREFPSITYLQDSAAVIDGVKFYGSPWTPWFHDWAFNLPVSDHPEYGTGPFGTPQEPTKTEEVWSKIPNDTDVLLTHGPPAGVLDGIPAGKRVGCPVLRMRVADVRPKLHVFGHIHHSYGHKMVEGTMFVNASTCTEQYKPTNPPIVVELENDRVHVRH